MSEPDYYTLGQILARALTDTDSEMYVIRFGEQNSLCLDGWVCNLSPAEINAVVAVSGVLEGLG